MEFKHTPVLLNECLEGLNIKSDGLYVDATLGGAGHSKHILDKLDKGHLYGFDQDQAAIDSATKNLEGYNKDKYTLIHENFKEMKECLIKLGVDQVDGILFDLGVSSYQLVDSDRGFSYKKDNVLDMRMDERNSLSAKDIVNTYSEEELAKLIYENSDERFSRKIAHAIVNYRKAKEISTTFELVKIIDDVMPGFSKRDTHPAKRTFQALRIEVNGELRILRASLENALKLLKPKGRLCVITFHSIEDRIVKQLFKEKTTNPSWHRGMPVMVEESKIEYRLVNTKPILPSEDEIINNHRSHSAKLRIIEKM